MAVRRPVGFGDLLRHERKRSGLTQEQLAERAGLSVRGISDLERGLNRAPYRSTVTRLADALGLQGQERALLEQASSRFGRNSPGAPLVTGPRAHPPGTPLIGRDRELGILRRHVQGELPPLLAIAGEPGIGKTRLLGAAEEMGMDLGLPVLRAGCQRSAGEQPYAPLSDALSAYAREFSSSQVRIALQGCGWLSRLLPELAELVPTPHLVGDLSPDAERRLLTGAVTRFLQNISAPHGVLLVLDDLQWAGRDGLELLLALARSRDETNVRIVCAYRATEISADGPLSTMLADASHACLVQQIILAPLSSGDSSLLIDALARDEIAPELREQVLARSGGVPFFLVSCASALRGNNIGNTSVPWSITQSVRQRIAALSDVAQGVLAVAAVAGRIVPTRLVMEVLEFPPRVIAAAIQATSRAGLLREHDRHSYAFTHDVIREVVEMDLGSARAMYLHLKVGDALEHLPGGPTARRAAELAWHFDRGDDAARALPYALLAGDHAASLYAHREAADLYSAAAGFASSLRDERAEAEAREKAGHELTLVAEFGSAVSILDGAASLYQAIGDTEAEARVVAQLGWTHFYRATPNEAVARVETLVERLRDRSPSASLARLSITLTFVWYVDRPRQALEAARRACRIAEEIGDERLLAAAKVRHGLVLGRIGRWDEGEQVLSEASALATRIGDIESLAYALEFAGIACSMQGKLEEGCDYYTRATETAERLGDPTAIAYGTRTCGAAHFALGDWEQARANFDRAKVIDARTAASTFSALIPTQTLELVVAQGRWEEIDTLAAECLALRHDQRNDRIDTNLLCLLAEADLLQGRPWDAFARLEPHLDDFYADEDVNLGVRTTPIEVCLATRDVDRADALLVQYADLIRKQGNRRAEPGMLRVRGTVRAAQSKLVEAEEAFSLASTMSSQMRYPLEQARALLDRARTVAAGDRNRQDALAGEAERIFRHLGAVPYATYAREILDEARRDRAAG